jgi:hypothetical protein
MSNEKGVKRIEVPQEFLKQLSFARRWLRIDDNKILLREKVIVIPKHLVERRDENLRKYLRKLRRLLDRQIDAISIR